MVNFQIVGYPLDTSNMQGILMEQVSDNAYGSKEEMFYLLKMSDDNEKKVLDLARRYAEQSTIPGRRALPTKQPMPQQPHSSQHLLDLARRYAEPISDEPPILQQSSPPYCQPLPTKAYESYLDFYNRLTREIPELEASSASGGACVDPAAVAAAPSASAPVSDAAAAVPVPGDSATASVAVAASGTSAPVSDAAATSAVSAPGDGACGGPATVSDVAAASDTSAPGDGACGWSATVSVAKPDSSGASAPCDGASGGLDVACVDPAAVVAAASGTSAPSDGASAVSAPGDGACGGPATVSVVAAAFGASAPCDDAIAVSAPGDGACGDPAAVAAAASSASAPCGGAFGASYGASPTGDFASAVSAASGVSGDSDADVTVTPRQTILESIEMEDLSPYVVEASSNRILRARLMYNAGVLQNMLEVAKYDFMMNRSCYKPIK